MKSILLRGGEKPKNTIDRLSVSERTEWAQEKVGVPPNP
jgi:hypothetical protein